MADQTQSGYPDYRIASTFQAHDSDVKQVAVTPDDSLVSCSRDDTIKVWGKGVYNPNSTNMLVNYRPSPPTQVNSVAYVEYKGSHYIFGGRKDGSIVVYEGNNTTPFIVLKAHAQNVCCLHINKEYSFVVSGGWDHNAIIWSLDGIVSGKDSDYLMLVGHQHSVWAIDSFRDIPDTVVTGSADRTTKLWQGNQLLRTFEAHKDVVRSIICLDGGYFVTGCNDGAIRLYERENEKCISFTSTQSEEYIYSMTTVDFEGHKYLITAMELGVLELYEITKEKNYRFQYKTSLQVPSTSAWTVATMNNKDIVVGGSDGFIYIFTWSHERLAKPDTLGTYDARMTNFLAEQNEVQQRMMAQQEQELTNIKVTLDDSGASLNLKYKKGTDPAIAAEEFIRANSLPLSYLNEIVEYIKINVPAAAKYEENKRLKAAASSLSTEENVVDGKKYDYVFDVKLDNGSPARLPYNIGEDPYVAAQRFVEMYNLPISKVQQIAKLLEIQIPDLAGFSRGNADPLTGGSSYSSQQQHQASGNGGYTDPLTGGGRYVPGTATEYTPLASMPLDKKRPRSGLVPIPALVPFTDLPPAVALEKLETFNAIQDPNTRLMDEHLGAIESIMKNPQTPVDTIHFEAIERGLRWGIDELAPILHTFCIGLLNEKMNTEMCGRRSHQVYERLINLVISEPKVNITIFILRSFANMAQHSAGEKMLQQDVSMICDIALKHIQSSNVKLQFAAAAVLANLSYILWRNTEIKKVTELGPREDAVRSFIKALEADFNFDISSNALTLLLQAIATVMWGDTSVIKLAKNRNILKYINVIKDKVGEEAVKGLARDIVEMIHAV